MGDRYGSKGGWEVAGRRGRAGALGSKELYMSTGLSELQAHSLKGCGVRCRVDYFCVCVCVCVFVWCAHARTREELFVGL